MMLSDECIEQLGWYIEGEWFEGELMRTADICIELIKPLSVSNQGTRKEANRRLTGLKNALSKLTENDKKKLSLSMAWLFYGTSDAYTIHQTFDMLEDVIIEELGKPALKNISHSRSLLIDFARIALRKKWFSKDENDKDIVMIDVLKVMMREAGVTHDARSIAKEARKLNQLNP